MGYKLLLTDDASALGNAICRALEDYPFTILRPPVDILESGGASLEGYWHEQRPSLLINTGAFDGKTSSANEALARLSATHQTLCIHLSCYRVFGTAYCEDSAGYDESVTPQPDDQLSRYLVELEQAFLTNPRALVLRTPWLAQPLGDNIFTRCAGRLLSGEPLEASDLHRGSITTVDDVARVVVAILLQMFCGAENWGIFHLHTTDSCSEAEFADFIARLLQKEGQQTGSIEIRRDSESRLSTGCALLSGTRCTNNFGVQLRSWKHGLRPVVAEWLKLQGQKT